MNLKSEMPALNQPEENVQALKGLIGWFNQSSLELIQEYRRLENRADYLKEQRESCESRAARDRKISTAIGQCQDSGKRSNGSFVSPGPRCLWS
jgi:hypothetical protein